MKLIKAFIRPEMLDPVYRALNDEGFCCMTVFKGEGTGKYMDPKKEEHSFLFPAMHSHMVKIEIAAKEENTGEIATIIREHAHTGARGDGIILISPIEYSVRIRDGKEGSEILL